MLFVHFLPSEDAESKTESSVNGSVEASLKVLERKQSVAVPALKKTTSITENASRRPLTARSGVHSEVASKSEISTLLTSRVLRSGSSSAGGKPLVGRGKGKSESKDTISKESSGGVETQLRYKNVKSVGAFLRAAGVVSNSSCQVMWCAEKDGSISLRDIVSGEVMKPRTTSTTTYPPSPTLALALALAQSLPLTYP